MSKHKYAPANEIESGPMVIFWLFICFGVSVCAMAAALLLRLR